MALLPSPDVSPGAPITPEEVKEVISTGQWSDEAALKLVIQDANRAEVFEATKQWVAHWPQATMVYQSPTLPVFWEGSQAQRANIPLFIVAKAVNSLVPQIMKGLFYENPPFMIQPRPGTSVQAARAVQAVLAYQLEEMGFKLEVRRGIQNAVLMGTNIWKWGFESYTRTRRVYRRKVEPIKLETGILGAPPVTIDPDDEDNIEMHEIEEQVAGPYFENIVNLRHVLVDPTLNVPDIRRAKYVIHRMYLDWDQLEELRERPGINLPSKEELLRILFPPREEPIADTAEVSPNSPLQDLKGEPRFHTPSADPLTMPLEVLERWDNKTNIMVLQQKLVILNAGNPYGVIPFFSVNWWDVPEAFYGMGLAKTIGGEQRLQAGIINTWLDNLSLNLNGVYVQVRGKSVPSQNIRISPGKIITVDNKDDLTPLRRLDAVPEAGQHLALSQQRAEEISGATSAAMQGIAGPTGHSNLARTAAGANMLAAGAGSQIEDFLDKFCDQVFIPFLDQMHQLNCALMPIKVLKTILNDELEHEFLKQEGDILEFLNARVKFSTLAGAKLMARRNMAQALPIMLQYLQSTPVQQGLALVGMKINTEELIRMIFEVSDWRNVNDVIIPMTDEDKKRWEMMQPAAVAQVKGQADLQSKLALQAQKHQNELETLNDRNIARAANDIFRQTIEQSGKQEAVLGEPTGPGFGSNA